jgi:hypothetical protein
LHHADEQTIKNRLFKRLQKKTKHGNHSQAREDGRHHLFIEAFGYRWYRVGGLDYLLKRRDIDSQAGRQRNR